MSCKDTSGRVRAQCLRWETTQRARCAQWHTEWTRRCDAWHTESERRCDRWEEEWTSRCSSWGPFAIFCLIWTWVSTWVCRAWTWITKTICDLWVWVSTTICTLWVLVTTTICRLWVFIVDFWCSFYCAILRLLTPNEFSQSRSECIYGWTAAYRIEEDSRECILRITLRIRLVADTGVSATDIATVIARWEPAIETTWSNQFPLVLSDGTCSCRQYRVVADVQFVASGEHHVVTVHPGSGRADMSNWFVNDPGGTAAHEAGHMLGNPDEYADPNCPARTVTSDSSIMQTTAGTVRQRHYQGFADWLSRRTCCTYRVSD